MQEDFGGFNLSHYLALYAVGVLASIAVEVLALVNELAQTDGVLPKKYRTFSYPIFRIAFAFVGAGPLAALLSGHTYITAFYVGISAPIIFDRVATVASTQPKSD